MQTINYGSIEFVFYFGLMLFLCLFLSDGLLYLVNKLTKASTREVDYPEERRYATEREIHEVEYDGGLEDTKLAHGIGWGPKYSHEEVC